ncbi:hypothetical protein C4D60_Mb05t20190 [Musa balbisiana]|uniref:Uncharacterized protein n=1 Tax=Musa balbisiana TaxID=52838 RepID=A0A4S8JXH6_MUSBA|nr:hypothetical protein C4D60_Mb05t20190 [Musa balbisiana]
MKGSWVRTITSPFRKAYTIFNAPRDKKPQAGDDQRGSKLQGEVMACTYEDVRVMWSILDKSRPREGIAGS